jgi:beta-barrel assembly-enhancing protease
MHACRSAALLIAGISLLMAQQPAGPAGDRADFYSVEKEAALGKQMAAEVRRRTSTIEDPSVQEYINRLGRRLAVEMPDAKFPFTFSMIADDPCPGTHEPGSLPGGYIFVPAALFIEAHGEAEFAGILAHSMEHVAERHATRQASVGQIANYGTIPLIFLGGWSGNCSDGLTIPISFRPVHRNNELEADGLAVKAMARAGFDPAALVNYLQRVQAPFTKPLSFEPTRDERVSAMNLMIEHLPALNYEETRSEFVEIQERIPRPVRRPPSVGPPTLQRVPNRIPPKLGQ